MNIPQPSIRFASDRSLLVTWPGPPSIETGAWVIKLFRSLKSVAPKWDIENLHPAYCSLSVDFGKKLSSPADLQDFLRELCREISYGETGGGAIVQVPVRYDGPDLEDVARLTSLTVGEVIRLHSESEYRVGFLGFSPGFPYMLGLREKLFCPRKSAPRLQVPAGSVAIAGYQTGIYPNESPGGWQLIGRTSAELFDPHRKPACLLQPGDRVHFKVLREPKPVAKKSKSLRIWHGHPTVEILRPGPFSTIQDGGRLMAAHLGISRGGAADPLAFAVGNRILGNDPRATAVEMTGMGMGVRFQKDAWFTVTGSACAPVLDGKPVEMWTPVQASAGQTLEMGAIEKLRAYFFMRGGFSADELLGSRSTFINGGWGGYDGRALKTGDILCEDDLAAGDPSYRARSLVLKRAYAENFGVLRATRGPQWDFFSDNARRAFFDSEYEVTNEANRLGLRLSGVNLEYAASERETEMISEGVAAGAVQVPAGGAPLILFCEQATTGGYPKIANIVYADLFRLGQLKPGDKIRFKEIQREEAWDLTREFEDSLQTMGFHG